MAFHKPQIQELTNFLIHYTTTMLSAGTYTSRISACVNRIALVYGYSVNINFFLHHITLNIIDKQDNAIQRTHVIPTKEAIIDFKLIQDLSALSWNIYDKKYKLKYAKKIFELLVNQKKHSFISTLILVSFANCAFCRLFQGDFEASILVFFGTLFGFSLKTFLTKINIDMKIQHIVCAFLSSWIVFLGVDMGFTKTPDIALGSSILYLIPGVFFINSIIDILNNHIIMGFSRIISVAILISCISIGIYMTLNVSNFGIIK